MSLKTVPYELKLSTFKQEKKSDVSLGVGRRAAVVNTAPPSGPPGIKKKRNQRKTAPHTSKLSTFKKEPGFL
jgi:hypothetical protein